MFVGRVVSCWSSTREARRAVTVRATSRLAPQLRPSVAPAAPWLPGPPAVSARSLRSLQRSSSWPVPSSPAQRAGCPLQKSCWRHGSISQLSGNTGEEILWSAKEQGKANFRESLHLLFASACVWTAELRLWPFAQHSPGVPSHTQSCLTRTSRA